MRRNFYSENSIEIMPFDFLCIQWVEPQKTNTSICQSGRRPEETRSDGSSLNSWLDKTSPKIEFLEIESREAFFRLDKIIKDGMDREEAETKLWLSFKDIKFTHFKFERKVTTKGCLIFS